MWGPEFGLETPVRASYGQGEAVCAVRAGGFLEPNHITLSKSHNFSVPWFPHTHKSLSIQWDHWEDTIHIAETLWTVSALSKHVKKVQFQDQPQCVLFLGMFLASEPRHMADRPNLLCMARAGPLISHFLGSVGKCLPSMHKAIGSIPSIYPPSPQEQHK